MTRQRLTPGQRYRLRQQLHTTDALGTYRRTLAVLLLDRGDTVTAVADLLAISRRSVQLWQARYLGHPVATALRSQHGGGRPCQWSEDEQAILRAALHQPPEHFGYQANGWTVPLLCEHLARWGLRDYSQTTVRRQLHAWGYVWKRPRYVLDPDPRRAQKMRRIRRWYQGLGPRDVAPFEDETDLLLFPPLRACWARRGESAVVPLCGGNARRVLFGTLNPRTGSRLFVVRARQRAEDFQALLEAVADHYRGWRVWLLLDEDPSHTAAGSERLAGRLGIGLRWLPVRCPELNALDHLWRHGKGEVCANRQYRTIDEQVRRFVHHLQGLSPEEARIKAGVLSQNYWLR